MWSSDCKNKSSIISLASTPPNPGIVFPCDYHCIFLSFNSFYLRNFTCSSRRRAPEVCEMLNFKENLYFFVTDNLYLITCKILNLFISSSCNFNWRYSFLAVANTRYLNYDLQRSNKGRGNAHTNPSERKSLSRKGESKFMTEFLKNVSFPGNSEAKKPRCYHPAVVLYHCPT